MSPGCKTDTEARGATLGWRRSPEAPLRSLRATLWALGNDRATAWRGTITLGGVWGGQTDRRRRRRKSNTRSGHTSRGKLLSSPAQPSSLPCGHPSPTRAAVRVTQAICLMGPPADGRLDSPENETRTRCVGGAPVSEAALCSVVLPARCCLSG